jgi:hypothetical protein
MAGVNDILGLLGRAASPEERAAIFRMAGEELKTPATPSVSQQGAKFISRIPGITWLAAIGIGIYYFSNEVQDLAAHWGIALGAKGAELVAKYKAVGEIVGKLSPEAQAALDKLPPEEKARVMNQFGDKSTAQIQTELLTKGKSLAEGEKQLDVKDKSAKVSAQIQSPAEILARHGINEAGPNGKLKPGTMSFTDAYQRGKLAEIMADKSLSNVEMESVLKTLTAGYELELKARTLSAQESTAVAQARKAEGTNNMIDSIMPGYLPSAPTGGNAPRGGYRAMAGGPDPLSPAGLRQGFGEYFGGGRPGFGA